MDEPRLEDILYASGIMDTTSCLNRRKEVEGSHGILSERPQEATTRARGILTLSVHCPGVFFPGREIGFACSLSEKQKPLTLYERLFFFAEDFIRFFALAFAVLTPGHSTLQAEGQTVLGSNESSFFDAVAEFFDLRHAHDNPVGEHGELSIFQRTFFAKCLYTALCLQTNACPHLDHACCPLLRVRASAAVLGLGGEPPLSCTHSMGRLSPREEMAVSAWVV